MSDDPLSSHSLILLCRVNDEGADNAAGALDVSAVMNRSIHQVLFPGSESVLGADMSSRVGGVTSSGFCSQPFAAIQSSGRVASSVPAPVETEEVIPLEECCFSLQKQRLGLSKLMARGRGGGAAMAGGLGTIE